MFHGRHGAVIFGLVLYIIVIIVGVFGFTVIEGWSLLDSFYMTIISISTVGYGEVHTMSDAGRLFTTVIIITGLGTVFFTTTMLGRVIIESEFRGNLRRRKLSKQIEKLKDHTIICGFGRVGSIVATEMHEDGFPFVVIESDPALEASLENLGYLYIIGDSTDEAIMRAAGAERASAILALLSSDADNLYLCIMGRELNPSAKIVSRALDDTAERRLRRSGADKVVATYRLAGNRVFQAAVRPTISDFIDLVSDRQQLALIMEEIRVHAGSSLIGKSLAGVQFRNEYHAIVVSIKRASGEMIFNPEPSVTLAENDIIITIGEDTHLRKLREACGQPTNI